MSDIALASMTFLGEMADHESVIDITVIGSDCDYAIHLSLADLNAISGTGTTLQRAIDDAYTKFRAKLNKHRN